MRSRKKRGRTGRMMNKRPTVEVQDATAVIDGKRIPIRGIRIDRAIDSGAHGSVFEGTEIALDRRVAVKIWYRLGEQVRQGAIGEVRKLASVSHPLFVTVYQLDVHDEAPYSTMELLPGPSLKTWLKENGRTRAADQKLVDYLYENKQNLRQRCKFWSLYSAGLRHLYSLDLLHGDPHVGNVIVFEDHLGSLNHFVSHTGLGSRDLAAIRILDLGTSLFKKGPSKIRKREAEIIFETAERLFPDFNPRQVMMINMSLEPVIILGILDKFVEYVLELASVPGMTKTDFDFMEHGLPQLLGWCPFFNYDEVSSHLTSLFTSSDAEGLISDTWHQMEWKLAGSVAGEPTEDREWSRLTIPDAVGKLKTSSRRARTPEWRDS
jgi:serine/threonine protein kinase